MKLEQAMEYITSKAIDIGYTKHQVSLFAWEVKELLNDVEDCSVENLDIIFDNLF